MKRILTALNDVVVLEPTIFADARGYFFESYNERHLAECIGRAPTFVQDNDSHSLQHVLRGLHYQIQQPQGKLIRVVAGEIFDVALDIRRKSPTFGQWHGILLSAQNKRQVWIPEGFAHGFMVTSASAEVLYKTTDYWAPEHERCILWNDPTLGIEWPLDVPPILSGKDQKGTLLIDAEVFE